MLSLQQEDQPQSTEEESSEEPEDNAQTEPLCQDSKTSCHPQAWPQSKSLNYSWWKQKLNAVIVDCGFTTLSVLSIDQG